MNSSISNSELASRATPDEGAAWRRFAGTVLVSTAVLTLLLGAIFVTLDPYDTGRMALLHRQGTTEVGGRLGHASRVHDEAFDAAIFGNSHILTLVPARLSRATGLRFVTLAVPGTGVAEQMMLLDAYLARHSTPKAVVIAVDTIYCQSDPRVRPPVPFPDWLYAPRRRDYLAGLFGEHTLTVLGRRFKYLFGSAMPQPRDGTFDIFAGVPHTPAQVAGLIAAAAPEGFDAAAPMPGFDMLRSRLDRVSPRTAIVLVMPPVAAATLPPAGSPGAAGLAACKAKLFALAQGRPNLTIVDWHRDTPETRNMSNFWDTTHYYEGLAGRVEDDISSTLVSTEGVAAIDASSPVTEREPHGSRALPSQTVVP